MDMKRILQAMDGAATKPVAGANEMARFLRAVTEADAAQTQPIPAEDPVIDNGDGSTRTNHPDGSYTITDGGGTTTYDASGKVIKHDSPRFAGYQQSTDAQGNVTQNYSQGPMSIQKGPQGTQASYQLGDKTLQTTVQETDLSKFLSIIDKNDVQILNEGSNPHKVSLPVQMAMQHYQQPAIKKPAKESIIHKYFVEAEEAAQQRADEKRQLMRQYAAVIAERVLMKESRLNEKSTSEKQARTMAAAAHDPEFAKKVGIKQSVAKEFNKADTGTKQLSQAMKKKKKKVKENNSYQIALEALEAEYGQDYQDMVKRVGEKAKQGPKKTVWDEKTRKYKVVPKQEKQNKESFNPKLGPNPGFKPGAGPGIMSNSPTE